MEFEFDSTREAELSKEWGWSGWLGLGLGGSVSALVSALVSGAKECCTRRNSSIQIL